MKEPEFKRPNHEDFMHSSELRNIEFSGVRHNCITQAAEIWILGEMKSSTPDAEMQLYPEKFNNLYADIFGLTKVEKENR